VSNTAPSTVLSTVRGYARAHSLLRPGPLILAVSGGADSTALALLLAELREEFGLVLHVAHFDHRARPRSAAADAAFVGEIANHVGATLRVGRADAAPKNEDDARSARYEFLRRVARELGALAQRVRDGKAALDDLRGGTFTITNIGALGGTAAIPIINYPEVAILAVARARQEAVVRQGQIVPRLMLPLTLTFDHRIADGADGARFASEIVQLLEAPERLLWEW